ncbi:preprotein translocase subunit SecG [Desulfuribacillus stibiiarsenatis]|uniref:Protein-export membrane protein SecG n=1 Tax=Desulfuribacillus stibiiarsenatis TaxID=1390249 RepID=A0A1E5L9J5_9FIRM|nr:preprotein translocase subunit SecG [Desulfuribacillus stibiiarsenatis]OEH86825.1 preprotein translocase subunit SecG [Desulfuribacillus stibiiarsenatis]
MVVLLKVLLALVSLALIAVVLLQPGKSAGLSGAITGGAEQMMGTKAKGYERVLERITKFVAIGFLLLSFIVAYLVQ